jgi:hypothetical protein
MLKVPCKDWVRLVGVWGNRIVAPYLRKLFLSSYHHVVRFLLLNSTLDYTERLGIDDLSFTPYIKFRVTCLHTKRYIFPRLLPI